jgi:hypothetical protein
MQSANFKITLLSEDDGDGGVQLDISITTELYKTSIDDYMSLEYFKEFGEALKAFPANPQNCVLELGEHSDRSYIYLSLRAYIYDTRGHAGLEVKMRRNGTPIISASSYFSIATEVASINAFGQALSDWVDSGEKIFSFDFYTGMH